MYSIKQLLIGLFIIFSVFFIVYGVGYYSGERYQLSKIKDTTSIIKNDTTHLPPTFSLPSPDTSYFLISYIAMYNGKTAYGNITASIRNPYYLTDTSLINYVYRTIGCKNPGIPKRRYIVLSVSPISKISCDSFYVGDKGASKPCR